MGIEYNLDMIAIESNNIKLLKAVSFNIRSMFNFKKLNGIQVYHI